MSEYTIRNVSDLLALPKATLRYYDQLGLVSPKRTDNGYRYYTEQDILDLRYTEVMKFSGFSLMDIRRVLTFKRERTVENLPKLIQIMADKKAELRHRIELSRHVIAYIDIVGDTMQTQQCPKDMLKMDALVGKIFDEMKECKNHE